MSQISQSWKLRRRASRLACARISRVSAKTLTSCGDSRFGTEAVGAFMAFSSLLMTHDRFLDHALVDRFIRSAAEPERELHRAELERAQQLRHGGQDLGRGERIGLFADDGREGALLDVGLHV